MKELVAGDSKLTFDEGSKVIKFGGSMRLANIQEYDKVKDFLFDCSDGLEEVSLDLNDLEFLNSAGITTLSMFVLKKNSDETSKTVNISGSKSVFWQEKAITNLSKLSSKVKANISD